MRVFIAVDGSEGSFEAVSQIGRLLSPARDEVALYNTPPDVRVRAAATDARLVERAREAMAAAIFAEARARLPQAIQAKAQTIVGIQDARNGILVEAEAWTADLIGVGARGLTTLSRLLLGSVSRTISHRSNRPVWVARAKPGGHSHPPKVLLTYETPETCRPAADLLARFSWPEGTTFTTLTVVPSIFAGRVPDWLEQQARSPEVEAMVRAWAREHDEELAASRKGLEEFVRSLSPPLNTSATVVTEGEPAREILAAIQKHEIDLIVVGAHKQSMVASMILGSTSDAVLNHAGCSVLVVPHGEGAR